MSGHRKGCLAHKGHHCTCGYPQPKPAQQLPTKTMPAQYDPVKENTEFVGQDVLIPVVHPSHTTQVNHTTYKHLHSYPHTKSVVNSVSHEHFCVPPKAAEEHCKPHHPSKFRRPKFW